MPERFEIYIVYKRRYINTLPFLLAHSDFLFDCYTRYTNTLMYVCMYCTWRPSALTTEPHGQVLKRAPRVRKIPAFGTNYDFT